MAGFDEFNKGAKSKEEELEKSRRRAVAAREKNAPKTPEEEDLAYEEADRIATRKANYGCLMAFLIFMGIIAAVFIIGFFYVSSEMSGKRATATSTVEITVVQGGGNARSISVQLKEYGLISDVNVFRIYQRFFYDSSRAFKYGTFELEPGWSYDEILEVLTKAQVARETRRVTFKEGQNVIEFAKEIEAAGLCTAEEFLEVANTGDFSDIGFFSRLEGDPDVFMRAEGFMAPNTYDFFTDESVYNIVRKFYLQFDKEMTEERYARMEERNLTLNQLITLASIVEKESGPPKHQPAVAQVFLNRLFADNSRSGLTRRTLGSDTTFFYLRDWVAPRFGGEYNTIPENIRNAYSTADSDPNAREFFPAGPICNPSSSAIDAVLYPENHKYFFFLTDHATDPVFYWAETYDKHLNNQKLADAADEARKNAATSEADG